MIGFDTVTTYVPFLVLSPWQTSRPVQECFPDHVDINFFVLGFVVGNCKERRDVASGKRIRLT